MTKEQRAELEPLSLEAFGNKNYYRKIDKNGLTHKLEDGSRVKLRLSFEGLKHYLEKTIKVRKDFLAAAEALKKKDKVEEVKNV